MKTVQELESQVQRLPKLDRIRLSEIRSALRVVRRRHMSGEMTRGQYEIFIRLCRDMLEGDVTTLSGRLD